MYLRVQFSAYILCIYRLIGMINKALYDVKVILSL